MRESRSPERAADDTRRPAAWAAFGISAAFFLFEYAARIEPGLAAQQIAESYGLSSRSFGSLASLCSSRDDLRVFYLQRWRSDVRDQPQSRNRFGRTRCSRPPGGPYPGVGWKCSWPAASTPSGPAAASIPMPTAKRFNVGGPASVPDMPGVADAPFFIPQRRVQSFPR